MNLEVSMGSWQWLALLWLAIVVILALRTQSALDRLHKVQETRFISTLLAKELGLSSDELTRFARLYAVTGKPAYEQAFWHVLEVRNGHRPRKDGRTVALRTLMEQAGFTEREFGLLREAEDLSNVLVKTEAVAMHAVKGMFDDGCGGFTRRAQPDLAMAARIMHGDDYQRAKAAILGKIGEFEHDIEKRTLDALQQRTREYERNGYLTLLAVPAMFVLAVISFFLMKRQFARPLLPVVETLRASSGALALTAERIVTSGQALEDGARAQAASVEQTVASLATLASGAQHNASLARQAREAAANARVAASSGARDMTEMGKVLQQIQKVAVELELAMDETRKSSAEVFQISRTVDAIALQTHILSLNAAVEAARAGPAGRGFAVVAGEVRTLSRSSADAARETGALIASAMARSEQGTRIMREVSNSLAQLVANTGKVDRRLQDIGREVVRVDTCMQQVVNASEQQSRGIDEISIAAGEVDRVVQDSAARADEYAQAAGALGVQARRLSSAVVQIEQLVGAGGQQLASTETTRLALAQ
jgi:methyl-accepting chemotaxis protein